MNTRRQPPTAACQPSALRMWIVKLVLFAGGNIQQQVGRSDVRQPRRAPRFPACRSPATDTRYWPIMAPSLGESVVS